MPMAAMMTAQGMAMPLILGRMVERISCPKKKEKKMTTACHSHRWMCDSCAAPQTDARLPLVNNPPETNQAAAADLLHDVVNEELVARQLGEPEGEV